MLNKEKRFIENRYCIANRKQPIKKVYCIKGIENGRTYALGAFTQNMFCFLNCLLVNLKTKGNRGERGEEVRHHEVFLGGGLI